MYRGVQLKKGYINSKMIVLKRELVCERQWGRLGKKGEEVESIVHVEDIHGVLKNRFSCTCHP